MNSPHHIAIILDGNRRFAKRLMLKPWEGHKFGYEKVKKLLEWCLELDINELTLYSFSVENFQRPKEEFDYLMVLFKNAFEKAKEDQRLHENQVKIKFLGRLHMFPKEIQKAMQELMDMTKDYNKNTINFCMAYGGRQEIVDAAKAIYEDIGNGVLNSDNVDEDTFKKYLYSEDEPDMIIRTGGEKRLSGFLLYASSYAELFFLDKYWPDFEKEDLQSCINDFSKRDRRFGR